MRSGRRPDSTYCLFTAGSKTAVHKHYDENNFVIFKNDFLALDSGTRRGAAPFGVSPQYSQENIDGTNWAETLGLCHYTGRPLTETGRKWYNIAP